MTRNSNGSGAGDEKYSVVSMFSGCGGMDLGFRGGFTVFGTTYDPLPFRIVWANDNNPAACRTYQQNLPGEVYCGDVREFMGTMPTRPDVIIGGFPCQDISINGKRTGVNGVRSSLYRAMVEAIARRKPRIFVAENVKGLLQKYNKETLAKILADFAELGYNLSYNLYLAADYGVPQMRQRVFIVGTAQGAKPFHAPWPIRQRGDWMTSKEAIGDLELLAGC